MGDAARVTLYMASISSNREIKRQQQKMEHVLTTKHIPFEVVDIVSSEEEKMRMRELCKDPTALPPKLFKGEEYLGGFDAFDDAVETGTLKEFLKI